LGQERPEDEEAGDAGLERWRDFLERAGSDVGDRSRCRRDQVVGGEMWRPAEPGRLKKGGDELDPIAVRNS
jgi:hypothetical protein